jgi:hypothetical protein
MATTIFDRTRRLYHFPKDPRLDRLLASFDPEIGYFKLPMKRRNARDLRKGLFGSVGLTDVPYAYGVRTYQLTGGWTLRLTYYVPPEGCREPGDVDAEFIPPWDPEERPERKKEPARSADVPSPSPSRRRTLSDASRGT